VQELLPNTVQSARQAASISNEMCHNADKSWDRRRESQADLALLRSKAKKGKICPGKRYSMMKKKSQVPLQLQVAKSGRLRKKQTALFALIRVI